MTYGALNKVTTADVEHAIEAISDVSNVGLLNWERQSLTCHFFLEVFAIVCYIFSLSFHPPVEDSSRPILIIL